MKTIENLIDINLKEYIYCHHLKLPRRNDQLKYELNKIGLNKFLLNRDILLNSVYARIQHNKTLTKAAILLSYQNDWETLVLSNGTKLITAVVLGAAEYSIEMRQASPLNILVTKTERVALFAQEELNIKTTKETKG